MRNLTRVAAALLVLLALLLAGYAWMLGRQPGPARLVVAAAPAPAQRVPLLVASRTVPAGRVLQAGDVRTEHLPVALAGALTDPAAAVGRIPTQEIVAGAPVLEMQLASGLAARLAPGERALAVRVDETSAAGHRIQPGDTVDVFMLLKRDGAEIDHSQARLLLARKRVLAYGNASVDMPADNGSGTAMGGPLRNEAARTAVLAVAVDEVHLLALAEGGGRLLLALRNPSDDALPDAAHGGLTLAALAHGKSGAPHLPPVVALPRAPAAPVAVRTAAPSGQAPGTGRTVEVIRGDRREFVTP